MSALSRKTGSGLFNVMRVKCWECTIPFRDAPVMNSLSPYRKFRKISNEIRCLWTANKNFSSESKDKIQQESPIESNFKSLASINEKIGFIGGGNMAYAIGSGLVNREIVKASQIIASDLNPYSLNRWRDIGTSTTEDNTEVLEQSDIIFLCLKPHILESCASQLRSNYVSSVRDKEKLLISVLAGVKLNILEKHLNFIKGLKIIRTMPNTPMQVGEGCTVYTPGSQVTKRDLEKVNLMMNALGVAEEVPEAIIDAIAGVTSCGPAFCFSIIEALADGSVKQGVPRQMALRFAAQTILGAAKTVLVTQKHPAILRDEVCSPGGSTICGVYELEKGNLRATLMNAVEASAKKNAALGTK